MGYCNKSKNYISVPKAVVVVNDLYSAFTCIIIQPLIIEKSMDFLSAGW